MDEVFERLSNAADTMLELRQFLIYRIAVYAIFGAIIVAYWIGALFIYWILSKLIEAVGLLFLLAAIAGNYGLLYVARSFLLYNVQAAYIAVLTQSLYGGLPAGVDQKTFAKQAVTDRFGDVQALALADQLIRGVVASFSRTVENVASWVPIPGMDQLVALVNGIIGLAVGTIDEAILSLVFLRKEQPLWDTVKEGVLLYAAAWQPVLKLSAALVVVDWLCTGLAFVMLLVLVGLPAATIFSGWALFRAMGIVIPFVLTYLLRHAIFQPLAVTVIVIAFHKSIKGATVDPALEEKLAAVSPQFAKIVEKAGAGGEPAPEAAAPAAPAKPKQRPGGLKKP